MNQQVALALRTFVGDDGALSCLRTLKSLRGVHLILTMITAATWLREAERDENADAFVAWFVASTALAELPPSAGIAVWTCAMTWALRRRVFHTKQAK